MRKDDSFQRQKYSNSFNPVLAWDVQELYESKVHISSYKKNKFWDSNVEHGDYS